MLTPAPPAWAVPRSLRSPARPRRLAVRSLPSGCDTALPAADFFGSSLDTSRSITSLGLPTLTILVTAEQGGYCSSGAGYG